MFVCNCLLTPTPIPPTIRQNKKLYHWAESFVLLSLYLTIFHLYIRTNGKTAMENLISVFTVYCIHISLHLQMVFCCFFFQFLGYLLVHVLNFFFSWNCILRKENIFAYLFPGTFVGWQLQNKLFNKPGLLTGSSGQIFQIKLNFCSCLFLPVSILNFVLVLTPPPTPALQRPSLGPAYLPSLIRDLVSFVRHKL